MQSSMWVCILSVSTPNIKSCSNWRESRNSFVSVTCFINSAIVVSKKINYNSYNIFTPVKWRVFVNVRFSETQVSVRNLWLPLLFILMVLKAKIKEAIFWSSCLLIIRIQTILVYSNKNVWLLTDTQWFFCCHHVWKLCNKLFHFFNCYTSSWFFLKLRWDQVGFLRQCSPNRFEIFVPKKYTQTKS